MSMLGVVSSASSIFSTPEATPVVVNPKDAADSTGFVQSIHLETPRFNGRFGSARPPKTNTVSVSCLVLLI